MGGQSGKGNSSAQTQQTATNQQVGVTSGIGIGAGAKANINISSDVPEVTKALASNFVAGDVAKTNAAFNFAGHAADVAAAVSNEAISTVGQTAALSIESGNDLATKFVRQVGDTAAQNTALLSSISQQNTAQELSLQRVANDALQSSFAVAHQTAPTDVTTGLTDTFQKIALYAAIAVAAIVAVIFLNKKSA